MDNTVSTDNIVSTVVNETIVTGQFYRRLVDKAAKLWQRISYWTHATDVEFADGKTAQDKLGNINGITSDFGVGKHDITASSALTKKIKDDLNEGIINDRIQLVIQNDGTLGWKKDGADAVIPFSSGVKYENLNTKVLVAGGILGGVSKTHTFIFQKGEWLLIQANAHSNNGYYIVENMSISNPNINSIVTMSGLSSNDGDDEHPKQQLEIFKIKVNTSTATLTYSNRIGNFFKSTGLIVAIKIK